LNFFNKFRSKGSFDWYVGWNDLKSYLLPYLNQESKILMVGCGNSSKENIKIKNFLKIVFRDE
jgi:hypothetical protein